MFEIVRIYIFSYACSYGFMCFKDNVYVISYVHSVIAYVSKNIFSYVYNYITSMRLKAVRILQAMFIHLIMLSVIAL